MSKPTHRRTRIHPARTSVRYRPNVETLEDRRLLAVTFELNFVGGNSIGFNHPIDGPMFRAAIQSVTFRLGESLLHDANIQLDVFAFAFTGTSVAKATSEVASSIPSGGFADAIIPAKIKGLGDGNGSNADGRVELFFFGPGDTLSYETDPEQVVPGEIDFQAVILHELVHTLGFTSATTASGSDDNGGGITKPGSWRPFDRFVSDVDGNRFIDENPNSVTAFQMDVSSTGWPLHSVGGKGADRGLFFDGPQATTVYGGRVPLYSPTTFSLVSSVSHLDSEGFPVANSVFSPRSFLMSHAIISGPAPQELTSLEKAILADVGIQVRQDNPPTFFVELGDTATTIFVESSDLVVHSGDADLLRRSHASVGVLDLRGGNRDDLVTLDFRGGELIPVRGLTLAGNGGQDQLTILGEHASLDLTDPKLDISGFTRIVLADDTSTSLTLNRAVVNRLSFTQNEISVVSGPNDLVVVKDAADWRMSDPIIEKDTFFLVGKNVLGGNETIRGDISRAFQNFFQHGDVDNSGTVTAADALVILFELNQPTVSDPETGDLQDPLTIARWPGIYFDSNGDNRVSALDALNVINDLFLRELAQTEGEFISAKLSFLNQHTVHRDKPVGFANTPMVLVMESTNRSIDISRPSRVDPIDAIDLVLVAWADSTTQNNASDGSAAIREMIDLLSYSFHHEGCWFLSAGQRE